MFFNEAAVRATEAAFVLPFFILGLSHIFQPAMWREFFADLHAMGAKGVIYRSFMLELIPATVLVMFHQVWRGWGLVLTLYGIALMAKITVSMLHPQFGLRSLAMAETHGNTGFRIAGIFLIGLGLLSAALARS